MKYKRSLGIMGGACVGLIMWLTEHAVREQLLGYFPYNKDPRIDID